MKKMKMIMCLLTVFLILGCNSMKNFPEAAYEGEKEVIREYEEEWKESREFGDDMVEAYISRALFKNINGNMLGFSYIGYLCETPVKISNKYLQMVMGLTENGFPKVTGDDYRMFWESFEDFKKEAMLRAGKWFVLEVSYVYRGNIDRDDTEIYRLFLDNRRMVFAGRLEEDGSVRGTMLRKP